MGFCFFSSSNGRCNLYCAGSRASPNLTCHVKGMHRDETFSRRYLPCYPPIGLIGTILTRLLSMFSRGWPQGPTTVWTAFWFGSQSHTSLPLQSVLLPVLEVPGSRLAGSEIRHSQRRSGRSFWLLDDSERKSGNWRCDLALPNSDVESWCVSAASGVPGSAPTFSFFLSDLNSSRGAALALAWTVQISAVLPSAGGASPQ
ncbi:hypothetical protein QBC34DRAFT_32508 [Podospora aff. communis PSN243]|uniref:C2H2-type domain-containing protein n=1 Tax=Podospora aff. communis PSN243 TaxID=3040156 RepID=A0AAV9GYV5_9PEZI|nr:hypothetical protein QBC34DRAFT_32508 [Podospora aff. communis PSN243]